MLHGTPAVVALMAATAGYEAVLEVGVEAIRRHSVHLTERLRQDMLGRGFRVPSPGDPARRGGTLTIGLDEGEDGPAFVAALASEGILVDHRPEAGIRVSPHFYTRADELAVFAETLSRLRATRSWRDFVTQRRVLLSPVPGTERIELEGHGGDPIVAAVVRPDGEGPLPGLLVVHEVFGLDGHVEDVARRFAAEGYLAIAPDLWSREGLPGPAPSAEDPAPAWSREQIRAAAASMPDRRALGDLERCLEWLEREPRVDAERLAVVGFCMGGNYAFQLGCTSRRLAAVVDFYGRLVYGELSQLHPIQPLELSLNLSCPLLGLFGGRDESIPPEQVERLESTLTQFAKRCEIEVYPDAGHGFFNPTRSGYHEGSARDAWARVLEFLTEELDPDA